MAISSELKKAFFELQEKLHDLDKIYVPYLNERFNPRLHVTDYFLVNFNKDETGYEYCVRRDDFPELTEDCLVLFNMYFHSI